MFNDANRENIGTLGGPNMDKKISKNDVIRKNNLLLNRLKKILCCNQNNPVTLPSSSKSIFSAAGTFGRPGIVIISPQTITMNSAPAANLTSRIEISCPEGAPLKDGSVENESVSYTHL